MSIVNVSAARMQPLKGWERRTRCGSIHAALGSPDGSGVYVPEEFR
jgi:hypothetical protein